MQKRPLIQAFIAIWTGPFSVHFGVFQRLYGGQNAVYAFGIMRRHRNRDSDLAGPIASLVGLVVLAVLLFPTLRQFLVGFGVLVAVLSLIVCVVVALHDRSWVSREPQPAVLVSEEVLSAPTLPAVATPPTTQELIGKFRHVDWFQFEKLVARIYEQLGFVVACRGGANPDGGIDLVLEKDGQQTAVQCKQWKSRNVGVKPVREFLGALKHAGIQKGIFITLQGYTGHAKLLAEQHNIEILNQTGLAELLEATNARFNPETLALLQDGQKLCPKCESTMVRRTTKRGPNIGRQFWGCSRYGQCDGKLF